MIKVYLHGVWLTLQRVFLTDQDRDWTGLMKVDEGVWWVSLFDAMHWLGTFLVLDGCKYAS